MNGINNFVDTTGAWQVESAAAAPDERYLGADGCGCPDATRQACGRED